jgi:prohibitin 2
MISLIKLIAILGSLALWFLWSFKPRQGKDWFEKNWLKEVHVSGIIAGCLVFILALIFISPLGYVPTGRRGVVLKFGAATGKVINQGIYYVTPLVENVELMDVRTKAFSAEAEAASKDLQDVKTNVTVNFNIDPNKAGLLYRNVGDERTYENVIIKPAVQEAVKAATALFDAEKLIVERPKVKDQIESYLEIRLSEYSDLTAVSITDFKFSDKFSEQVEQKVTMTQSALTAEQELKKVQYEAQQRIAQAEGEARAIQIQANAIREQGGREYVQLQLIKQWAASYRM